MAKNGTVSLVVKHKSGKRKSVVCPMSLDQYVNEARGFVTTTKNVNPEFVAWVSRMAGKANDNA
jgi:hypothetical protein